MALKKDLEKALDIIADAQGAKDEKSIQKAVAASDKFEKSVDKELAEKVDSIVNNIVHADESKDEGVKGGATTADSEKLAAAAKGDGAKGGTTAEESAKIAEAAPNAPEKKRLTPEEEAAFQKERLKKIPGRPQIPD